MHVCRASTASPGSRTDLAPSAREVSSSDDNRLQAGASPASRHRDGPRSRSPDRRQAGTCSLSASRSGRRAPDRPGVPRTLLSFGLVGGLDPALRARHGSAPLGHPLAEAEIFQADPALSSANLGQGHPEPLLDMPTIVVTREEKARLFAATGAVACDMESGAVARVAARHGLPFAVLRAICDPAGVRSRLQHWWHLTSRAPSASPACWPRSRATPSSFRDCSASPATPRGRAAR